MAGSLGGTVDRTLRLIIVFLLVFSAHAAAQDKVGTTAASFLKQTPSARAWGLGRAGSAILDPYVGFYNPGGLGIYANGARLTLARNSQDWLADYVDASNFGNSVAVAGIPLNDPDSSWLRLNVALSYMRTRYRIETILHFTNPPEDNLFVLCQNIDSYGAALALGQGLSVGVGGSIRSFDERQSGDYSFGSYGASGVARDLGIFLQIPIIAARTQYPLARMHYDFAGFQPEVWVLTSYAWANFGKDVTLSGGHYEYPLPRINRFGRTVIAGIRYHGAHCVQALFTRDDEISKTGGGEDRREGWEVSFFGIVQMREGQYPYDGSYTNTETSGESYHLAGVWPWLDIIMDREDRSAIPSFVRRLDMVFQRARIKEEPHVIQSGNDLWEFGVTLDLASVSHE